MSDAADPVITKVYRENLFYSAGAFLQRRGSEWLMLGYQCTLRQQERSPTRYRTYF
jgi:hypothetical protein